MDTWNILIVDDEKEITDLLEVYLSSEGYRVFKFYCGQDALDCVEREHIDLAILDVMLPDVDGFTLCRKIREKMHENSRKPKFIKTVWGIGYKLEE